MGKALIIVDVQNDFCEGGALPVEGGAQIAKSINSYASEKHEQYDVVVGTRCFHIDPKDHWSETPDFKTSWPKHCEAGTNGAMFHPDIDIKLFDIIISKGMTSAAYSGFDGIDDKYKGLLTILELSGVDEVDIVGIATDYCVKATAIDAVLYGFKTNVLLDLTVAVSPETKLEAIKEMENAGVAIG